MKKVLLLFAALIVAAGAMAQNIYVGGQLTGGTVKKAAVWKNGNLLYQDINNADMHCRKVKVHPSGNVWWIANTDNEGANCWGEVYRNSEMYFDNNGEMEIQFSDLCWTEDGYMRYVGWSKNFSAYETAMAWTTDGVLYQLGDGTKWSKATCCEWLNGHLYTGGHIVEGSYWHAAIWCDGDLVWEENNTSAFRTTQIWDVDIKENAYGTKYLVFSGFSANNNNESSAVLFTGTSGNYTLIGNSTSREGTSVATDGFDVYVTCGYSLTDDSNTVLAFNGSNITVNGTFGNSAAFATESGLYTVGFNKIYKIKNTTGGHNYYSELISTISNCDKLRSVWVMNDGCSSSSARTDYTDHFEIGNTDWNCWTKVSGLDPETHDNYRDWTRNQSSWTYGSNTYTTMAAVHYYHDYTTSDWLISPKLYIPSDHYGYLTFETFEDYVDDYDYEGVWIGTSLDLNSFHEIWTQDDPQDEWSTVELEDELVPYRGQYFYIAFVYEGYNAHKWVVDDFDFYTWADGIDEEGEEAELRVTPNPANSYIRVKGLDGTEEVNIYNTLGQVVKSTRLSNGQSLNISDLSAGVYMLRSESSTEVVKFTVK